jgi:hypothetical protein
LTRSALEVAAAMESVLERVSTGRERTPCVSRDDWGISAPMREDLLMESAEWAG